MLRTRIPAFATLIVLITAMSGCSSSGKQPVAIGQYSMGEKAQAGRLLYTVFDTKWVPQLGEGVTARVPSSRYFLIRMSIVNSGSGENTVPAMTLIDDQGNRYAEQTDGEGVPQWVGILRRLKSADTLSGFALFDVPPRHYKLEVSDDSSEGKAQIDIPLTFTDDSPLTPTIQMPGPNGPEAQPPLRK
jgi:hypothetical protein